MTIQLTAASTGTRDPAPVAQFWATLLNRPLISGPAGIAVPGKQGELSLRWVADSAPAVDADRWHLHVTSSSHPDQQNVVAQALRLGASHLDVGQRTEEGHIVLADPGGGVFCVIEPYNAYLEGCGLLGELACKGTRSVGLFWSEALEWPLAWDQDEETAIQSPLGGPKIAWGGPQTMAPKTMPNRQRLVLATDGPDGLSTEIDRLVKLGATQLQTHPEGAVEMADPDGNEFWVTSS